MEKGIEMIVLIISSISILIDGARIDHSILGNVVILDK